MPRRLPPAAALAEEIRQLRATGDKMAAECLRLSVERRVVKAKQAELSDLYFEWTAIKPAKLDGRRARKA